MCVMSMIGDHYEEKWFPDKITITPEIVWPTYIPPTGPTQQEFDDLKKEVLEMRKLLKKAKQYDEDTGQKDCEIEEKMELLRKVAEAVGVDLDDVIGDRK